MKTKVISIVLAAIILASVFVAMVPVTSADSRTIIFGNLAMIVQGTKQVNLLGFIGAASATLVGATGTNIEGETHSIADTSNFNVPTTWSEGLYSVQGTALTGYGQKPTITTAVYLTDETMVTGGSIVEGQPFYVRVSTNFGYVLGNDEYPMTLSLTVINPDGAQITADANGVLSFTRTDVDTDTVRFPATGTYILTRLVYIQ